MTLIELLKIELLKTKRSKILPLLFIAPLLIVGSGVANISMYLTPEYTNAWAAMFIQSALLYAYYLLPFSMIVVCTMLAIQETQNNALNKMLTLPIDRHMISLAKFIVLSIYLLIEMLIFFITFIIAGMIAINTAGIQETMPLSYLLGCCISLFLTMMPCIAVMWLLTVIFEKPLISIGLNLILTIPGLIIGASPWWYVYPYCYSGHLISCSLHAFSTSGTDTTFALFPFIPCAFIIFITALLISTMQFGKKEIR